MPYYVISDSGNTTTTTGGSAPLPVQPTLWTIAIVEHGATLSGQPQTHVRATIPDRPADVKFFTLWGYQGAATTDLSLYASLVSNKMAATGDTLIDWWLDRGDADEVWQFIVTASNETYVPPALTSVVRTLTIPAAAAAAQPTAFSVTVETADAGGVPTGRYHVSFTPPVDLEYWTTLIDRIWCDSSFTPVPGAEWLNFGTNDTGSFIGEWWPLPSAAEYWIFRGRSVTRAGIVNETGAVTDTVTVPASTGVGAPPSPGPVTLGTAAAREFEMQGDIWHISYAIPYQPPSPLNGFDRLYVNLQAPDDAVDKATINTDGTAGFIIDDASGTASKLVDLTEPEQKVELLWNPDEQIIRIKHPAPLYLEIWRVIVYSGTPGGRSTSAATVLVEAGPPPSGPEGTEYAAVVTGFAVVFQEDTTNGYKVNAATGRKAVYIRSAWARPDHTDSRTWYGGIVEMKRSDDASPDRWYILTGTQTDEEEVHIIEQIPDVSSRFTFRFRSIGAGGTNSYVYLITPETSIVVDPPPVAVPLQNATGFSVTASYVDGGYGGRRKLELVPQFTSPDDPARADYESVPKREDLKWYLLGYPSSPGEPGKAIIEQLPSIAFAWQFALVPQDIESRNRAGDVETIPQAWPDGTAIASTHIEPLNVANPVANVTDFSVLPEYIQVDYSGKPVLRISPIFTRPADTLFDSIEFWAKREDEVWYLLGYPATSGYASAALIDQLPQVAFDWEFAAVAQDAYGRNRDGDVETNDPFWPAGTPTVIAGINPPNTSLPVSNATGFTVDWVYVGSDYYGAEALRLEPKFTVPADRQWNYAEFWGQGPSGDWRILSYPSKGGLSNAAIIELQPTAAHVWKFALVAFDVTGRNRDGNLETVAPTWPAGTPTFEVNIPPPSGKLDGNKIENIPAAAYAEGLTAMYLGTVMPVLPDAKYPEGTPWMNTSTQPAKMYKAKKVGTVWSWDPQVDGTDIVARTIFGVSLVAGAVGTAELSTTEILVGPGSGRPVRFVVRDLLGNLLCMIGDEALPPPNEASSFRGLYARNCKIAPGLLSTDKYLYADGTKLEMKGGTFELVLNGVTTEIKNLSDPGYGQFVGLSVRKTGAGLANRSIVSAGGMATFNTWDRVGADMYADGNTGHGKVRVNKVLVQGPPGGPGVIMQEVISLNGDDGSVRASVFFAGGNVGVSGSLSYVKPGGASGIITFAGGIIVTVT